MCYKVKFYKYEHPTSKGGTFNTEILSQFYLLQTSDLEIGQMRVPDLFTRGQIDENDPSRLGSEDRVRMVVLKSRGQNWISLLLLEMTRCHILCLEIE